MNPLIALALWIMVIVAIVKSRNKVWAAVRIIGWTVGIATVAGLSGYLLCVISHNGNAPAVAGDLAAIAMNLTLLIRSIIELSRGKVIAPPPEPPQQPSRET